MRFVSQEICLISITISPLHKLLISKFPNKSAVVNLFKFKTLTEAPTNGVLS
jgi:hypothetical protein